MVGSNMGGPEGNGLGFHRNAWYVAALPEQIGRSLDRRIILNEPVLLYREENGTVVALHDRCPHRFAPLSRGTLAGDRVQCRYHGLAFDASGRCVVNPHGGFISPNSFVRKFPVEERHGLVWIWMGQTEACDPRTIADLGYMTAADLRTVHSYLHADYRYDILVDNLMDLSHAEYLHLGSFMSGASARSETKVREEEGGVVIRYRQFDAPAPPEAVGLGERVDQLFRICWQPGNVMTFERRTVPAGGDIEQAPAVRFCHIATPESAGRTHYFMSITRDFDLDDPAVDARMAARQRGVIEAEDSPMLEAVDREMNGRDLLGMRPVILPTDSGSLYVRRVISRLIKAEAAGRQDAHSLPE